MTTVGVTGGIGLDLKNWVKTYDGDGNLLLNKDGEPILKEPILLILEPYLLLIQKLKNYTVEIRN